MATDEPPPKKRYNTSTLLEQFQKPRQRAKWIGIGVLAVVVLGLLYMVFLHDYGPPQASVEEMFAKKPKEAAKEETPPASAPASAPVVQPASTPPPAPPPPPAEPAKPVKGKKKPAGKKKKH